jgi:lycopene beta-cyclase
LEALLQMPPADVPAFFERFFALPEVHRWTYLTGRDDVRGTVAAMNCLFRSSDGRLRRHLVTSAVLHPLHMSGAARAPLPQQHRDSETRPARLQP